MAVDYAPKAEKDAKSAGRNLLTLYFMRRSGEHAQARLPWTCTSWFQEVTQNFAAGATDRWAYRLRAELPTLQAPDLPDAAVSAEIRRLVDRTRKDDAASGSSGPSGTDAEQWWQNFSGAVRQHSEKKQRTPPSTAECLKMFTLLCQGASFVARGHDG